MDALIKLGMMILTGSSMDLDLMQHTRQTYECDSTTLLLFVQS
jgi:hypothetical protein